MGGYYWGVIWIIFVGYHLVRWYKTAPMRIIPAASWDGPQGEQPLVSFLVPAWNARMDIAGFIESYRVLKYPRKELILCPGGSDGSLEVAKAASVRDMVVIEQMAGEGKQRALRKSFPYAKGSIVYLTDIDCRLNDETVNSLLRALIVEGDKVVTGSSRPMDYQLQDPFVQAQMAVDIVTQPTTKSPVQGILGRNAGLWRDVIEATGCFATEAPSGTDYTLAKEVIRAGYNIEFVPGEPIPTEYPERMRTYIRKQSRWIRNVYVLGKRYGAVSEVQSTEKTILTALFLGLALLVGVLWIHQALILFGLLAVHSVLNRFRYLKIAGMPLRLRGIVEHFVGDQCASFRAIFYILSRNFSW